ncbi:hypothetical protein CMQ_711 [Grosmannia clavigera kw1407]|uniref:ubiquitinyl hydrolase 1 n=1 Tax=Grosmannia clavigera (strain kw1407 / UAMH 11150) TaxID=655863 RepID=F0XEW3_GROCL|nr:uncharacterized protein CMQ_711 [Grosmannia clavigera kw1407]EFX03783.1 hypothetical protein CMQ_711 [Grosmannia clavigera kw1407]
MEDLERVFNHVVLPPKLPEEHDPDIPFLEHALLQRLMDAAKMLHETTNHSFDGGWTVLRSCLQSTRILNSETLDRLTLKVSFQALLQEHNRVLVCHVVEQNAALLLHRRTDANNNDLVVFEAFEASPQSQDVLAAPNALRWEFPSRAAQIPIADFENEGFQSALASFLDKASSEQLSHLAAKASKDGVSFSEIRNPGSPALITHMLITVIEAMGSVSDVEHLNKRVRDDVHLKKGNIPWRRLPFWLVLRVAAQRQLHLAFGPITGQAAYKTLLSALLAKLLDDYVENSMDPSQIILLKKKLCRRLAKLQRPSTQRFEGVHQLLKDTEAMFQSSIENADRHVNAVFAYFKASAIRKIPLLPARIKDGASELRLSLPSSQAYLRLLQSSHRAATWAAPQYTVKTGVRRSLMDQSDDSGILKMQRFGQKYRSVETAMDLAGRRAAQFWTNQSLTEEYTQNTATKECLALSAVLESLMSDISTLNDTNPEHCSAFLLSIFDLWAAMDAAAALACPMLLDYSPAFRAELLDVLQLPSLKDMQRLRRIQVYLRDRQEMSKHQDTTIFGLLGDRCFGADFTERSMELRVLRERINDLEWRNREQKKKDWEQECEELSHPPTQPDGPSSYTAVSNRPKCPTGMSVHEFEAYQRLLSGRERRWLTMLVELGSSNLNFSKVDTMLLMSHLANQAGPMMSVSCAEDTSHDTALGVCHAVFSDMSFVQRLTEEIGKRLSIIRGNWHEINMMELLITLSSRLYSLVRNTAERQKVLNLIELARETTLGWIHILQNEVAHANEGSVAQQASMYAFKAALLCRRTMVIFSEGGTKSLSPSDISSYIRASVALQQNFVVDLETLSEVDKAMLQRDFSMATLLQDKIRTAISSNPDIVTMAIAHGVGMMGEHETVTVGTEGTTADLKYTCWEFLPSPNGGWISSELSRGPASRFQRIDFHYIEGHILVDGKTIAKLPQEIRDSEDVKELFENQHLLTLPSSLPGMTHRLTRDYKGHYVHFGMRNKRVVILTNSKHGEWEFVPRRIFIDEGNTYDLPRSLVDNCVHWYNIQNRTVDFRRKSDIWFTRKQFWFLDITNQQMYKPNNSTLVDPHSQLCKRIASIFNGFADPQRLTVLQPRKSPLSVELRHLDLSFFVNGSGMLHCKELSSEIDPNQDAGTLYGYESMIVLRDVYDHRRRSLILPLGSLRWKRTGPHVSVQTDIGELPRGRGVGPRAPHSADSTYARFGIDTILGRLTCPPELLLLYTKARLHAVTSFPLADPLTGRTGDEEAVQTLTSGRCQPWVPLGYGPADILQQIKILSPKRLFYPKNMRILQQVSWDANLPTHVQHDHYGRLVQELFSKSKNLSHFNESAAMASNGDDESNESTDKTGVEDDHSSALGMRSEIQRLRYESPQTGDLVSLDTENNDRQYNSLGRMSGPFPNAEKKDAFNTSSVFQITKLLREEAREIPMARLMSKLMSSWTLMGGFDTALETDLVTLSTLMSTLTMSERWGPLVELCRRATWSNAAEIMFTLAIIAFSPGIDMDYVHLLAAYSYLPRLKVLTPPQHASYDRFRFEEKPTAETLKVLISSAYREYQTNKGGSVGWSSALAEYRKKCADYQAECEKEGTELAHKLLQQWPIYSEPSAMGFSSKKIDVALALSTITPEWKRLIQNKDLTDYVRNIQMALMPHRTIRKEGLRLRNVTESAVTCGGLVPARLTVVPSLYQHLLQRNMPPQQEQYPAMGANPLTILARRSEFAPMPVSSLQSELVELGRIVSSFTRCPSLLRKDYARDLSESIGALARVAGKDAEGGASSNEILPGEAEIDSYIQYATAWCDAVLRHIRGHLSSGGKASGLLQKADLWPRLTPVSILELLRSTSECRYGDNVRETLVTYGCAVAALQRLHRVRRIFKKHDLQRATEEWRNRGHLNWSPAEQTDWLLFEIDSDLLIRTEQVEVARAIIAPASGKNSVLQLNMGKGKTSCIVPMAIASLANGKQLARLVVPKALLLPTAQMLQARLGGLVGRELRHVPFSRRIAAGANVQSVLEIFQEHHNDLMRRRGVLLAAPEHILAFKLSGLQCLADGKNAIARDMIDFQQKLADEMCRDILDESDFTLAVRTQLVYPSGSLSAVDAAPHRWKMAQMLLAIVEDNLPRLCQQFGNSIRVLQRPFGGFPMIYILRTDIGEELYRCIVHDISSGRVSFFRPTPSSSRTRRGSRQQMPVAPKEVARLLRQALSRDADDKDINKAAAMFADVRSAADGLTLIRGLLLNNILLTCLAKRWNVQYGLHPHRWPIAVPFEAKGVPSERSEFGHPDVAILLTCLAFYYIGLNRSQFCEGLKHVLQHTDDPASEYERWTAGAVGLPSELQHWNMINVDDSAQVQKLGGYLRWTRPVIDHYLNTFVFPLHSRQFSVKLQGSAWDLPLFRAGTATTGFSGTNDNKMMLPLTIKQEDLPSLRQTNAEVLTYLLKPRNRNYRCMGTGTQRWREEDLLASLVKERIHVLIDAGAYILEKDNESLAREWLDKDIHRNRQRYEDDDYNAAVFFSADNRAWVLSRDATAEKMPLLASPFVDQLDKCLVYFDEAHTRGVDLLLPPKSRGALTLALGQTKDHTVQAAMRLRQLGTTQSVIFYAPPEVDESIREVSRSRLEGPMRAAGSRGRIESPHVICWLLEQTCLANEQLHPLYLSHGYDFCRRASAQWKYGSKLAEDRSRAALLDVLQQPERQTVAQLYGNSPEVSWTTKAAKTAQKLALPELEAFSMTLQLQQRQDGAVLGVSGGAWRTQAQTTGAFEEVEQEREVEAQVEQVRAQQRRVQFEALVFPGQVHRNIRAFVRTGILGGDRGYKPAFASMAQTELGSRYGVQALWPTRLFVSDEFDRTIVEEGGRGGDDFLRPVEWTIWSPTTETALVVVPEELELLLPRIRSRESRVHLLAYAAPITRPMATTFSGLQYLALPALPAGSRLPAWLPVELGILAGRLYMTLDEAVAMAEYLGGSMMEDVAAAADARTDAKETPSLFCPDPASFLLEWLSLRRVGQDIMHTPAAYICQGRVIRPDHAFFAGAGDGGRGSRLSTSSGESGRTSSPDVALFSEGGEVESDSSESGESGEREKE